MKLGLIFAACLLVAGCGAAESVDSNFAPTNDSGSSTGTGDDSATGTSSGDDGGSVTPPGNDAGTNTGDSGSSGGDDGGSTTADSGTGGGDDGGSPSTDSGSGGGGDDGGGSSADSGSSGGGDDGGGSTADSGSGGGDDGGVSTTDSGSGGSPDGGTSDSGSGGSTDSGSGDSGSCHAHSCVYTQGYYKNHTSSWTVLPVVMGTNSYDESACLSLLNDPSVGDASLILAKQYIAAVENGGLCDPNASATMAQAEQWFTDNQNGTLPYGVSLPMGGCASDHTSVPCQAYWLGQSLDSYNNGLSGTPACQ